jgi:hypothetical protein
MFKNTRSDPHPNTHQTLLVQDNGAVGANLHLRDGHSLLVFDLARYLFFSRLRDLRRRRNFRDGVRRRCRGSPLALDGRGWLRRDVTVVFILPKRESNELDESSTIKVTVKAPNFGPHGNFGPLFQKGLLSLKRVLQKNEENKSCRKTLDLQIWFCSFFLYMIHPQKLQSLQEKVRSFLEVQS